MLNLAAVDHPANLFPLPGEPLIMDSEGDQIGTSAQDIISADFAWDAATNELIYSMEMADLDTLAPGMRWTQSSVFSGIRVFVSTSVIETTAIEADYGTIAPDPNTGVTTQTTIGPADQVEIDGNRVVVRLNLDKIDAAVGFPVAGTTSTATLAQSQILIGSSLTGGLLLNSDSATGTDFDVSDDDIDDDNGTPGVCAEKFTERLAGAILPGAGMTEIAFSMRCTNLKAKINFHPGNQDVAFDLMDVHGDWVASGEASNGRSIEISGLTFIPAPYQ